MATAETSIDVHDTGSARVTLPSRVEVLAATDQAVHQLTADLLTLSADAWAIPACGSWTVDETVAHLALGPIAYSVITEQMATGGTEQLFDVTDPDFTEAQAELIGTAEPDERIDAIEGSFGQFTEAAREVPDEQLLEATWTPEGIMPVVAGLSIALNELVVHGYEVRTATGLEPLPAAANPDALAAFTVYACTGLIKAGGWPAIELDVSGSGPVVVAWDGDRVVLGADVEPQVRLGSPAGVFALLLWGRLSLDAARSQYGVTVTGSAEGAEAFLAAARPF